MAKNPPPQPQRPHFSPLPYLPPRAKAVHIPSESLLHGMPAAHFAQMRLQRNPYPAAGGSARSGGPQAELPTIKRIRDYGP